jgi:hypothetical protein
MECQKVKSKHGHLAILLQPLLIPEWKWGVVSIDCITKLPKTIVVDKLTKVAHFIPMKLTHKATNIVAIYIKEISRLHDVPKEIVSNRDSKFASNFWRGLFKGFGTNLNFSREYHLKSDG